MAEEKNLNPSPRKGEKPVTPGQQRRRQRSVFQYMAVLFAAAFVLLLLTFMMEKRQFVLLQQQNEEQIDDLEQSSVSAVNSIKNLYIQNDDLRRQVAELEEQLKEQTQTHQNEKTTLLQTIEARDKSLRAMDWFWQIDEAFVRGRYSLCRELIQSLDDAQLTEFLPKQSITENERFSPYDRLAEIREAVK